ncbi:nucleoporin Nup37 isoform X2 [Labeo rohita]|uniref:Nucleoporin Nup37 isoform X2 n=1 Tax=Labeo rohita TaxID=84645 RepID=A0A498MFK6_LABRO|nr:nucleoporin Nup37 isoform X2 [Labeo rohita]
MPDETVRSATYTVPCEDYVHVVEFSPFDCGLPASLLAYGGNQYVVVGTCRFKEEDTEVEDVEFTSLQVFVHGVRVDAIAWSPETRLDKLPQVIRVWDLDGNETISFRLRSPGVSVCWHPEDNFKLMVAEKKGTIRFYDLVTQHAILSLDSGQVPLMSADWCLTNTIKVGAVVANDWVIWDITRSSYPLEKRPAHADKARHFSPIPNATGELPSLDRDACVVGETDAMLFVLQQLNPEDEDKHGKLKCKENTRRRELCFFPRKAQETL